MKQIQIRPNTYAILYKQLQCWVAEEKWQQHMPRKKQNIAQGHLKFTLDQIFMPFYT